MQCGKKIPLNCFYTSTHLISTNTLVYMIICTAESFAILVYTLLLYLQVHTHKHQNAIRGLHMHVCIQSHMHTCRQEPGICLPARTGVDLRWKLILLQVKHSFQDDF